MVITNIKNYPNILINEKILEIDTNKKENTLDAKGAILLPLSIDLNVKNSESIKHLSKAALNGGIGTFLLIPKHKPITNKLHLQYNITKAQNKPIDLFVAIEGITNGKLNDIASLYKRGAKAIFINSDENMNLIQRVFEYASMLKIPVFVNPFNKKLAAGGVVNNSELSFKMGLSGINNFVESVEVAKILELAKNFDAKIVFQSISTKESLLILENRPKNIYVDISIDNLLFDDIFIEDFNTLFKTMPPLRSEEDKNALIDFIKKDKADFISSNHIAVKMKDKDVAFEEAEYGLSKLDIFSHLVYSLDIDINIATKLISTNPAKLFNLKKGEIKQNYDADLMLVEFAQKEIDPNQFKSKGKNFPRIKTNFKINHIIKNGEIIC